MSLLPPKKNVAYIFYTGLVDQSNSKLLKANPTLATGDVQVSIDGGSFNNLGTLPTVTPASGRAVKVSLSASEMNGDNIVVVFSDQAGAEWCDALISIQTLTQPFIKGVALSSFMFMMTDGSSHTPKTGLVNGDFTKKISIDGAAGASLTGTITEVDATNLPGIYKIDLSASELTGDVIALSFSASSCDTTDLTFTTSA